MSQVLHEDAGDIWTCSQTTCSPAVTSWMLICTADINASAVWAPTPAELTSTTHDLGFPRGKIYLSIKMFWECADSDRTWVGPSINITAGVHSLRGSLGAPDYCNLSWGPCIWHQNSAANQPAGSQISLYYLHHTPVAVCIWCEFAITVWGSERNRTFLCLSHDQILHSRSPSSACVQSAIVSGLCGHSSW